MATARFYYHLMYRTADTTQPTFIYHLVTKIDPEPGNRRIANILAVLTPTENPDAVIWDRKTSTWAYRPNIAAALLAKPKDPGKLGLMVVDRAMAEHSARELTPEPLPSEAELTRICAEGRSTWKPEFRYHLMFKPNSTVPANLIALTESMGSLMAVAWDYDRRAWTFQPDVAMAVIYLHPERHQTRMVDRKTAETEIQAFTMTPLPAESELTAMGLRSLPSVPGRPWPEYPGRTATMALLVDFSKVEEDEQEVKYAFGYPTMDRTLVISKATRTGNPMDGNRDRMFTAVLVKILRLSKDSPEWPSRGAYMA